MATIPIHPNAPTWFRRALAVPYTDGEIVVGGAAIHYVAWGEPGRRGLVFVHGGGAQAHWWTHIAARFAREFRVLAIDLSGHGDSAHREAYELAQWTDEVIAVADAGGIEGRPVVIGHSMGGFVTIATAALHPDRLDGVIICDSPVTTPDPEVRSYQTQGRVRTSPHVRHRRRSTRSVPHRCRSRPTTSTSSSTTSPAAPPARCDGGWQWKFDRAIFESFGGGMRGIAKPYLPRVRCRFALLRSQRGLVTRDIGAEMYEALGRVAPVIELPEAGHHPMLDQPLVLLTAIRTLLADWDHSSPLRPGQRDGG